MTLDEKLDNFYNSVIEDATTQSQDVIEEYKKSLQKVYDDHKNDELRKAASTIAVETETLIREKNKTLSAQSIESRRLLSEKTKELTDILFVDVKEKLNSFMKTPEYKQLLIEQIYVAKRYAQDNNFILYINPSDKDKVDELKQATGIDVTVSTTEFMGGTRAVIHTKGILIDNSFSTKLTEEKDRFTL